MTHFKKRHKYGIAPKADRTVDGIVFDSKREAKRYSELKLAEKYGDIRDLVIKPVFKWMETCTANGREVIRKRRYTADFSYQDLQTGKVVIEDVKGVRTVDYKRRKKIVETLYEIEIREV